MPNFICLKNIYSYIRNREFREHILPLQGQIKAWQKANRKMSWKIREDEFKSLASIPVLTEDDIQQGFIGAALFYGFGDDGCGNADPVLSGRLAWEYALKRRRGKTWRCEYIDFEKSEDIRLRPGGPARPKGFYFCQDSAREKISEHDRISITKES